MYDPNMVQPMVEELTRAGIKELKSPDEVDKYFEGHKGTSLVFVNSVCGCAAGSARPGLIESLSNSVKPDDVVTVFAGVDKDATDKARSYFYGYPPSSPSMGLFRDGELVHMIERHHIEGTDGKMLGDFLKKVYDKYCGESVNESMDVRDPFSDLEIDASEVKEKFDQNGIELLDCRDEYEKNLADIPGTTLITQDLAEEMIQNWDKDKDIVIYCHRGNRSMQAVQYFRQYGFKNVKSLKGGIEQWSEKVDTSIPKY